MTGERPSSLFGPHNSGGPDCYRVQTSGLAHEVREECRRVIAFFDLREQAERSKAADARALADRERLDGWNAVADRLERVAARLENLRERP